MKTIKIIATCKAGGEELLPGDIARVTDASAFQLVNGKKAVYQEELDPILNRDMRRGDS